NVGGGYAGNFGVLGPIDWERSTKRENRADRFRGAMVPPAASRLPGNLVVSSARNLFQGIRYRRTRCHRTTWNGSPPRSSHAGSVRGSFDTASRSLERNGRRSAIGSTGAGPSRDGRPRGAASRR